MRYLSVCSGIEAATVAWHPLGWEPAAFCEIDPFPAAVLAHHFPGVPNHGDFTQLLDPDHPVRRQHVDLLVGGTPCQSFSVAGLRCGLEDPRGNLALAFVSLAAAIQPRWVVWENVPGALSADGGRAFGSILGALADLGYGFAWRVLDAQWARVDGYPRAVPQRRRRVFLVGHSGGLASRAAAVLFEPEGVFGDSPPRREAGAGVAAPTARGVGTCGADDNQAQAGHLVAFSSKDYGADASGEVSPCLRAAGHHGSHMNSGAPPAVAFHATQDPISSSTRSPCLSGGNKGGCASVAVGFYSTLGSQGGGVHEGVSPPLKVGTKGTGTGNSAVQQNMKVRRLTERECERLQGFPDDWTAIPWNGKPASECPSGHRYKALGNSMAVNVMRWLGARISMVDET